MIHHVLFLLFLLSSPSFFSSSSSASWSSCVEGVVLIPDSTTIFTDTTWPTNSGPYHIQGRLNIIAKLTIEHNNIIQFAEDSRIHVSTNDGSIVAQGTAANPIEFKSINETSHIWGGIRFISDIITFQYSIGNDPDSDDPLDYPFSPAGGSIFEHCIFIGGGFSTPSGPMYAVISVESGPEGSVAINECQFIGKLDKTKISPGSFDAVTGEVFSYDGRQLFSTAVRSQGALLFTRNNVSNYLVGVSQYGPIAYGNQLVAENTFTNIHGVVLSIKETSLITCSASFIYKNIVRDSGSLLSYNDNATSGLTCDTHNRPLMSISTLCRLYMRDNIFENNVGNFSLLAICSIDFTFFRGNIFQNNSITTYMEEDAPYVFSSSIFSLILMGYSGSYDSTLRRNIVRNNRVYSAGGFALPLIFIYSDPSEILAPSYSLSYLIIENNNITKGNEQHPTSAILLNSRSATLANGIFLNPSLDFEIFIMTPYQFFEVHDITNSYWGSVDGAAVRSRVWWFGSTSRLLDSSLPPPAVYLYSPYCANSAFTSHIFDPLAGFSGYIQNSDIYKTWSGTVYISATVIIDSSNIIVFGVIVSQGNSTSRIQFVPSNIDGTPSVPGYWGSIVTKPGWTGWSRCKYASGQEATYAPSFLQDGALFYNIETTNKYCNIFDYTDIMYGGVNPDYAVLTADWGSMLSQALLVMRYSSISFSLISPALKILTYTSDYRVYITHSTFQHINNDAIYGHLNLLYNNSFSDIYGSAYRGPVQTYPLTIYPFISSNYITNITATRDIMIVSPPVVFSWNTITNCTFTNTTDTSSVINVRTTPTSYYPRIVFSTISRISSLPSASSRLVTCPDGDFMDNKLVHNQVTQECMYIAGTIYGNYVGKNIVIDNECIPLAFHSLLRNDFSWNSAYYPNAHDQFYNNIFVNNTVPVNISKSVDTAISVNSSSVFFP
eukprot:TRINITY_DN12150_c0_g1_i1.p1 TRINITY_DN12150_c0_g1~~TRINITY_DN12150_c0_g1_i1.p1  ORF type:complete len:946 (-),score=98.59 TRINITY_DN12150_c0_g1_i1:57-2894(-)